MKSKILRYVLNRFFALFPSTRLPKSRSHDCSNSVGSRCPSSRSGWTRSSASSERTTKRSVRQQHSSIHQTCDSDNQQLRYESWLFSWFWLKGVYRVLDSSQFITCGSSPRYIHPCLWYWKSVRYFATSRPPFLLSFLSFLFPSWERKNGEKEIRKKKQESRSDCLSAYLRQADRVGRRTELRAIT